MEASKINQKILPKIRNSHSFNFRHSILAERYSLNPFAQHIDRLSHTKNRNSSICQLLTSIRKEVQQKEAQQFLMTKNKEINTKRHKKKQNRILLKQKKLLYLQTEPNDKQNKVYVTPLNVTIQKMIQNTQFLTISQINSCMKPPHRYKTGLAIDNNKIYLYGGIGCQKDIKWGQLDLMTKKWILPNNLPNICSQSSFHPNIPVYGHTFSCYKGKGFAYGGISHDIMNDLTILDLSTYQFRQGAKCKYRRKQHSAAMIGKFMFIHGGIQDNQTRNNIYYYDTEHNQWGYFYSNSELPFLSHHSMTSSYNSIKNKRKISKLSEITDSLYIFGGKKQNGEPSNRLFKITINSQSSATSTEIKYDEECGPQRRFSCCFHFVSSKYLLVYGGRQNQQVCSKNQKKGVFNDIYLFNLQNSIWIKQQVQKTVQNRYGMASSVLDGTVYIFGGCTQQKYANGNIITMKFLLCLGNLKTQKSISTKVKLMTKREIMNIRS